MDRERSRSPLGRGRATSPSPSTPDSAGGGASAQLSRHTDSSLDDMEFLRSSCRLVQDSGTQPLESSTDDLDYYRRFCTSSLEQQQPEQERWALHAVIRKCIVLSDMYFHFFFPQHISLSLFWLSTSSLLPNLFTEIIIILECGLVLFSHTQWNATTCQSFRSESLSVAAGPPSQTTPSRPRSVSTRGRGRGHQPSPSQSGLTPRSRREQFQQQLQCRNNCGALFGLERSRSRHEVHNCPARNEVS